MPLMLPFGGRATTEGIPRTASCCGAPRLSRRCRLGYQAVQTTFSMFLQATVPGISSSSCTCTEWLRAKRLCFSRTLFLLHVAGTLFAPVWAPQSVSQRTLFHTKAAHFHNDKSGRDRIPRCQV